jgi:polyphenol oxidase
VSSPTPEFVRAPVDGPCVAVFTTRRGGSSHGPYAALNLGGTVEDAPADVAANRQAVCAALGVDPESVVVGRQVHGAHVRHVGSGELPSPFLDAPHVWRDGDGLVSSLPGVGVGVFAADCLPVLLWRRDLPKVAAVHAGWRGLVAGILEGAVTQLGPAARLGAAIGPGIGPCCYPVSVEIRDRFVARFGEQVLAGNAVDLVGAARAALVGAGLAASAVWALETCTSCDGDRWFSFRRDGAPTGRQLGLIWPISSSVWTGP